MINVGDIIRSYDFGKEVQPDTYMVGTIVDIVDDMIHCKTVHQYAGGNRVEKCSPIFRTPVQGASLMDDVWTRIEKIA